VLEKGKKKDSGLITPGFSVQDGEGGRAKTKSQPKKVGFSFYPSKLAHIQRAFTPWYPVSSSSKTGNAISGVLYTYWCNPKVLDSLRLALFPYLICDGVQYAGS